MSSYSGGYLWPPRPSDAFPCESLSSLEREGIWGMQAKKNGTCTLLAWDGSRLTVFDRHQKVQAWMMPDETRDAFSFSGKPFALAAELIHNKVKGVRNKVYVFDIMAHDGITLVGTKFKDRMSLLRTLYPGGTIEPTHRDMGGGAWIARTFTDGFAAFYESIVPNPMDEGVVLKRLNAPLCNLYREGANGSWQQKCRKPTKNYRF